MTIAFEVRRVSIGQRSLLNPNRSKSELNHVKQRRKLLDSRDPNLIKVLIGDIILHERIACLCNSNFPCTVPPLPTMSSSYAAKELESNGVRLFRSESLLRRGQAGVDTS